MVALRIELSTTRLSAVSGPPALDYRFQSGTPESNRNPPAPKAGVLPSAPLPVCQSERPDLNRRSPGPRPGAMPGFATFCCQRLVRESNPPRRLERAREPQWLGLSLPKKKRRGEERRRTCSTETYLCESALVQNSLLAPCNFAGVSSQGGVTGGIGEDAVSKGPGRETSGDSRYGRPSTPSTALSQKRWGSYLMILSLPAMRLSATNHGRCCLRPPGEKGPRP